MRDTMSTYGPTQDTSGGRALKYYASVRIEIRRTSTEKAMVIGIDGKPEERKVKNTVVIKVLKNKMAPPFREVSTTIRFGMGVSKYDEVLDIGAQFGVLLKAGAYIKYKGR